jgi:hypothetical protein
LKFAYIWSCPPVGWPSSQRSIVSMLLPDADQADAEKPMSASPPLTWMVSLATKLSPLWLGRTALLSG